MKRHALTLAFCLGAAAPAFAQDNLCAAADDGQWIGGSAAASDLATSADYLEQMALVLGQTPYVARFTLSADTDIRIEAQGRGAGDPLIELITDTGSLILSDDDSGGNGSARAETSLDAGTYCVAMRSYNDAPMTGFLRIGRPEHEALTSGISEGLPEDVVTGSGICDDSESFGPLGGQVTRAANGPVFLHFDLDAPTPVTITASNETADPAIALFAPDGSVVAENDDFDGLNARLDLADPLPAGRYCIELRALNDMSAPITLAVDRYDAADASTQLFARGDTAPPLDGSYPVAELGVLERDLAAEVTTDTDVQWLAFTVESDSFAVITAKGTSENDPWLVLFNARGEQIGMNDDDGSSLDSQLAKQLPAGTYLLGVKQIAGPAGTTAIIISRYVRAD